MKSPVVKAAAASFVGLALSGHGIRAQQLIDADAVIAGLAGLRGEVPLRDGDEVDWSHKDCEQWKSVIEHTKGSIGTCESKVKCDLRPTFYCDVSDISKPIVCDYTKKDKPMDGCPPQNPKRGNKNTGNRPAANAKNCIDLQKSACASSIMTGKCVEIDECNVGGFSCDLRHGHTERWTCSSRSSVAPRPRSSAQHGSSMAAAAVWAALTAGAMV